MKESWDHSVIAARVQACSQSILRDSHSNHLVIVTFDEQGISGHANHVSTHHGVNLFKRQLANSSNTDVTVHVWNLETKYILLKYSFWIGALVNWFTTSSKVHVFMNVESISTTWEGMKAHASQFVWYRRLFVPFSIYSYHSPVINVSD